MIKGILSGLAILHSWNETNVILDELAGHTRVDLVLNRNVVELEFI